LVRDLQGAEGVAGGEGGNEEGGHNIDKATEGLRLRAGTIVGHI
jgi:hypothetical protein